MIKNIFVLITFFLASYALQAQNKFDFDTWPEIKAFHKVMSQTFHPSEEGNLKPIKERSGEMVDKAIALSKSKIPAELDAKKMKKAIKTLVKETKKVNKLVKSGANDKSITDALIVAHDAFHNIVGLCSNEHH